MDACFAPRSWFLTGISFVAASCCHRGILSEKSEFVDKLRLFVMPAGVLHFVAFCFDFGLCIKNKLEGGICHE